MATWCYNAFGLNVRSELRLRGMRAVDGCADSVSLRLSDADEIDSAWTGTAQELVGTLPDGCRCVAELARSGMRRLTYSDRAVYLLSADTKTILCAPQDVTEPSWQRFLLDAVLLKASEAHGLHALHASAVEGPDGVLAFATRAGGGKSSLAAELVRRGHAFFTDDALAIDRANGHVRAHPAPPFMNFPLPHPEGFPATDLGVIHATIGPEAWLAVENAASQPRRVARIYLLDRRPGLGPGLDLLPASPVHLLPHALSGGGSPASATRRFELLADVAAAAAIYRLRADPEIGVAQLADLVESAL